MPSIPNHTPSCRWLDKHPTQCKHCKDKLVYCECSCGSKFLLNTSDGVKHNCSGMQQARYRASMQYKIDQARKNTVDGVAICPMCKTRVGAKRWRKHVAIACPNRHLQRT